MDARSNVKMRLADYDLSYTWLIHEMQRRGVEVDKSTMSSVINATITGERVTKILDLAVRILDKYETVWLCKPAGEE